MKLSDLLSELEKIGVEISCRKIPISGRTVYELRTKLPSPPFREGATAWYPLVIDRGQEFVPQEEVEAIKLRLWHGSTTFGAGTN